MDQDQGPAVYPRVEHQLFPDRACYLLTPTPQATGRDLARCLAGLFERVPGICAWDLVEDFTRFSGDASNTDVAEIAAAYAQHRVDDGRIKFTVFATSDANFAFWAVAMDHFFPDRKHLVAPTLEAAWAMLEAASAERK